MAAGFGLDPQEYTLNQQAIQENAFKLKDDQINLAQKTAAFKQEQLFQKALAAATDMPADPIDAAFRTADMAFSNGLPAQGASLMEKASTAAEHRAKSEDIAHNMRMESLDRVAGLLNGVPEDANPNDPAVQSKWHETALRIITDNPKLPPETINMLKGNYNPDVVKFMKTRVVSAKEEAEIQFKKAETHRQEALARRDEEYTRLVIPSIVKRNEASAVAKRKIGITGTSDLLKPEEIKGAAAEVALTKSFRTPEDESAYSRDVAEQAREFKDLGLGPKKSYELAMKKVDRERGTDYAGKWRPTRTGPGSVEKPIPATADTQFTEGSWYNINGHVVYAIGKDDKTGKETFLTKEEYDSRKKGN